MKWRVLLANMLKHLLSSADHKCLLRWPLKCTGTSYWIEDEPNIRAYQGA